MNKFSVNPGNDSFGTQIEKGYLYVDKTEMIHEFLTESFRTPVLFTRPRRFGKTMVMTMFRDFLDIRRDSKALFQGLNIMKHPDTVGKYMNQYPVIFISLKDVNGNGFEKVFDILKNQIASIFRQYEELLKDESISKFDKLDYESICSQTADYATVVSSLKLLAAMLHKHYGEKAFVIVDEYDVPMAKALGKPCYNDVADMVQSMLSNVGKTTEHIEALMMSGCLHTVKNSGYTGFNNLASYSILSYQYSDCFGFTEEEVSRILAEAGMVDKAGLAREWYDGYVFGETHIYNPWDVIKYVDETTSGSRRRKMPGKHWIHTSESREDLVHGFIGKMPDALGSFERLLNGETIVKKVNEALPYHMLHASGSNLWTGLLETGYLTKATEEDDDVLPLRIPNKEITEVFREEVWCFFSTHVENVFLEELMNALWKGNGDGAKGALDQILEATLSYLHAYKEYVYQHILAGVFIGQSYRVRTEYESGYGRSDIIVEDAARKRALVLELKQVEDEKDLGKGIAEACDQTKAKKYESSLIYDGYTDIKKYGLSFWDKRCLIKAM